MVDCDSRVKGRTGAAGVTEDSCASANPSSELNSFKFGKNMLAGEGEILTFVGLCPNEAVMCNGSVADNQNRKSKVDEHERSMIDFGKDKIFEGHGERGLFNKGTLGFTNLCIILLLLLVLFTLTLTLFIVVIFVLLIILTTLVVTESR